MVSPSSPGYLASPSCSSWHSAFLCVLPSLLSPSYPPILLALQSAFSLGVFHHCMLFWAACSLAFFGFLRVREFTCSGSDPHIHLFPVRRVVRSLGQHPPPHQVFDHGPFSQRRPSLYWSFG